VSDFMARGRWGLLIVVGLSMVLVGAGPASQPVKGSAVKTLKTRMIKVDFKDTKLVDCFTSIVTAAPLNFQIRWKVMEAAGVDKNDPITLSMENRSAGDILQAILNKTKPIKTKLVYQIDSNDTVVISTKDDLAQNQPIRRGR
jgi:hypothetical protein